MRPIGVLVACNLAGCLLPNPDYDAASAGSGGAGVASEGEPTTTTTTTTTAGSATTWVDTESAGEVATDSAGGSMEGGDTSTSDTTGCVEEPLYLDGDGDGWGAGEPMLVCPGEPGFVEQDGDCDDGQMNIHPGANEQCDPDRRDEDCDGLVNESSPDNPTCDGCTLGGFGGHSYWFCPGAAGWDQARGVCSGFGSAAVTVDLTIVDSGDENGFLFTNQVAVLGAGEMWLGGRDVDAMGTTYTWYDGSALVYHNWVVSDLDDGCIVMRADEDGRWSDRPCATAYGFACESTE